MNCRGSEKDSGGGRQTGATQPYVWDKDRVRAWCVAQDLVVKAVVLYPPRPHFEVLMIPDASDAHWGCPLPQVPRSIYGSGAPVDDLTRQPLEYVSGLFWDSQIWWSTMNKGGYAAVHSMRGLDDLT